MEDSFVDLNQSRVMPGGSHSVDASGKGSSATGVSGTTQVRSNNVNWKL